MGLSVKMELNDLPKRLKRKLLKEIAQYGERAYRRGFQHALHMRENGYNVDEELASKLRLASYEHVYEVYEGNVEQKISGKLYKKKSIYYRLNIEKTGELIQKLAQILPSYF